MSWILPSLSALRTFEAVARHLSFTRAALELHVTQSAVSRQIRTLEDYVGVRLFERTQQRVTLTQVGESYLRDVRGSLEKIQEATLKLLTEPVGGMLHVATPPAFGMRWLIPRLERFHHTHPDVLISLVTRAAVFDFSSEKIDAAIHYGHNDWPGVTSVPLMSDEIVLIGAPDYIKSLGGVNEPEDLSRATLLQHIRRPNTWRDWLEAVKASGVNPWAGPRFEHFYMIIQAAAAGLGLGIVPRTIVAEELESGRIVVPFRTCVVSSDTYCLVFPESKSDDRRLQYLRTWLVREAKAYEAAHHAQAS